MHCGDSVNDMTSETDANGSILPFARRRPFRTAARQTGLSLRPQNRWMVEITHCGQNGFLLVG